MTKCSPPSRVARGAKPRGRPATGDCIMLCIPTRTDALLFYHAQAWNIGFSVCSRIALQILKSMQSWCSKATLLFFLGAILYYLDTVGDYENSVSLSLPMRRGCVRWSSENIVGVSNVISQFKLFILCYIHLQSRVTYNQP